MVLTNTDAIVAFSDGNVAIEQRKIILAKVNLNDYSMNVFAVESNVVPYKLIWNDTNGLTILGNINNLDGTSSIHLLRVSYWYCLIKYFIDFTSSHSCNW